MNKPIYIDICMCVNNDTNANNNNHNFRFAVADSTDQSNCSLSIYCAFKLPCVEGMAKVSGEGLECSSAILLDKTAASAIHSIHCVCLHVSACGFRS